MKKHCAFPAPALLYRLIRLALALAVIMAFTPTVSVLGGSSPFESPTPNPPPSENPALPAAVLPATPQQSSLAEWTYHKTGDNLHPDGNEQQMMWLMNRARSNPAQEGVWLATTTDPEIASPRNYFHVNTALLQSEFAGYAAKPPAAFDARLWQAAKAHSDYLIANDTQSHDGQAARVASSGFVYTDLGMSVFSYALSAIYAHAGFNIDWDSSSDGMQDSRGHRRALMAVDRDYVNIGLAMVPENNPATGVGPLVVSINYAIANTTQPNHYNRFLVGTVWNDLDSDSFYDPGEGIGGVTATPSGGAFFAITSNSGGYAIPITAANTYTVSFTGSGVDESRQVTVGETSVLLNVVAIPELGDERVYLPLTVR